MTRQSLPIGIQDFATIRSEDFYYVDKTPLIWRLVEEGRHYFLSRPRRFDKSLLVDTLKALFAGREDLFRGLDIHDHWDWSVTHPVVRLSFDGKYGTPGEIEGDVIEQLEAVEREYGLAPAPTSATGPRRLRNLLDRLHRQTGQRVAVLVDEYDKPILDGLPDLDRARANRETLRGVYGIIKGSAEHVRFVFVTGVSMFSRVSLFSDMNNLEDISLDPRFATICGYTDTDIDTVFAPEIDGLDRNEIRRWYNGYHWRGETRLYNPFDVLLLLRTHRFRPYWFQTGSPRFLFETLRAKSISPMELENRVADESLMSTFEIDDIDVKALLFQTGYLTIVNERSDGFDTLYRLDYPNHEVRVSLNRGLLQYLGKTVTEATGQGRGLRALLEANDFAGFAETLRGYLASIPYSWHNNDLARYEAWYAGLLHTCFRATGVDARAEEASSHGRDDMVVRTGGQVFILEFKMADTAADADTKLAEAFTRMRERGYANRYRDREEPVHLVAVVCGREVRNLLEVRAEPAVIA